MAKYNRLFIHCYISLCLSALTSRLVRSANTLPLSVPFDQSYVIKIDPTKTTSLDDFCHQLNAVGLKHSVSFDFTNIAPETFYGATIRLENAGDVDIFSMVPAVQSVTPVSILKPIDPVSQQILNKPLKTARNPQGYAPHVQTRVSDLHAMGYYGQGIKVGLIDSGVDCNHPALGGGFGPNHKIAFGYDLVGDEYNGSNEPKPKASPCTPCATHGTHTLGIVGAADVGFGFQGVAPNATLGMYLIGCDSAGGTRNDIVVQALLMAFRDGADVISASIGGVGGWSKGDVLSDVINSLVSKGATIILAAGNEGEEGLFYAESPAAATKSMAIGSVESKTELINKFATNSGRKVPYYTSGSWSGENLRVYATSPHHVEDDACSPLPESTPDLKKYVVLVQRGTCPFAQKAANVVAKGANKIFFYMNGKERASIESLIEGAQTAAIVKEDGEWMLEQIKKDPGFSISFTAGLHSYVTTQKGGFVSDFSQYGPSYDFKNLQPNFLGVGGNIVSTMPVALGSFAQMSGTSMATPMVSGIAALVKSIRGRDLPVDKLRRILTTTAQQVFALPGKPNVETVTHQGGGLVDAVCAAFANTTISIGSIALNDLAMFQGQQSFTITNDGDKTLSYRVGHIPADTVPTFPKGGHRAAPNVVPVPGSPSATVQFNPTTFNLAPKSSQTIKAVFTPPRGIDPALLAIYSGYISLITDSECETHSVPYYGVAGVMKDQAILDLGQDSGKFIQYNLPRLTGADRKPKPNNLFEFNANDECNVRYRFSFGTPYSRLDLLPGNAQLQNGNPSPGNLIPAMADISDNFTDTVKDTFRGAKLVGMLADSNATYVSRTAKNDTVVHTWDGTVVPHGQSKSVDVPNGSYKILIRALRVNGNPLNDFDYDTWLSPVLTVKRSA